LKIGRRWLKPEKSWSTANNWTWKLVEDNWSLRSPEVQLTVELELIEDNYSLWSLKYNLKVGKKQLKPEKSWSTANSLTWIDRRQLQSMKPEVQLPLHLKAWASWWILPIPNNRQRSKKILQEGMKQRKRRQEEGSGNSSIDSVNSGSEPDYQICILLGWAPW
jgi:hypothetical protein